MRVLSDKPNELKIHDNISDSDMVLYYRTPTAKEVAGYSNGMSKRVRNKLVNCTGQCRQKYGKDILMGYREGDFGVERNGKPVVISSDPDSKDYDPKWKELFCKGAADLVEHLAIHVFEAPASTDDGVELPEDEPGGDDADPN